MKKLIIKEIEADAKKFGDARRTLIEEAVPAVASVKAPMVADEPVTVILSKNGWLRARAGHDIDMTQLGFKPGDALLAAIETRSVNPVVVLDSHGRAYSILASDAPAGRSDGVPITSLIELQSGAKVRFMLSAEADRKYLFAGQGGYGFISKLGNLVARPRAGKAFLTLETEEEPLLPLPLPEQTSDLWIGCGTSSGRLALFPLAEMKELDKGKGVKLVSLDAGARLVAVRAYSGDRLALQISVRGRTLPFILSGEELERHRVHRAARGGYLPKKGVLA